MIYSYFQRKLQEFNVASSLKTVTANNVLMQLILLITKNK